jgi:hypothetical protein
MGGGIQDPLQDIIVPKKHKEVLRMVHMHHERPRRQAEVTHDVSLDIGMRQLRLSASDHNDKSALERDIIRRNLHGVRDDARLRPRTSGRVAQRWRRGGFEGETTIRGRPASAPEAATGGCVSQTAAAGRPSRPDLGGGSCGAPAT